MTKCQVRRLAGLSLLMLAMTIAFLPAMIALGFAKFMLGLFAALTLTAMIIGGIVLVMEDK